MDEKEKKDIAGDADACADCTAGDTEDKKYITWKTAHEDIDQQRSQGYIGKKFIIFLKLVNKNQDKTGIIEKKWNKKFGRYVPKHCARSSDCEVQKKKVPVKPVWEYHIISVKKL